MHRTIVSKSTILESTKCQHAIQSGLDYGNLNMWQPLRILLDTKKTDNKAIVQSKYINLITNFYFIIFSQP